MSTQRITPIHYRRLVKVFELDGFVLKRQKGDHLILTKTWGEETGCHQEEPKRSPSDPYSDEPADGRD